MMDTTTKKLLEEALAEQEAVTDDMLFEAENSYKPYSDPQMRAVLNGPHTDDEAVKWAHILGRTPEAIKMLWKWCHTREKIIAIRRGGYKDNAFIQQIIRIRKEIGWVI